MDVMLRCSGRLLAAWLTVSPVFAAALPENGFPVLSPAQMNCGDTVLTDDSGLNEVQAHAIALSLNQIYEVKAAKSPTKGFPHARRLDGYVLAFCGVTRNGRRFVIVDGIYKFLGTLICDDSAGFAIAYDPASRTFGDMIFGVSSCVPPKQKKL
jgi:hypothetical protein